MEEIENDQKYKDSGVAFDSQAKTSQRLHYEAQVKVIRQQIGSLESVRATLGLSSRKMAQLLMVDPSAWSRWTKSSEGPPPHVWRALQWYMAMQEKIPGLTPQYFLGKDPEVLQQISNQKIEQVEIRLRDFLICSEI